MSEHLLIPDTQVKPGVPIDHLRACGNYIVQKKPDTIVMIGDFADMESLSGHEERGSMFFEGKRYKADIESVHEAMDTLLGPVLEYNKMRAKNGKKQYKPRLVLTLGNHETRITRYVNKDPKLQGLMSLDDLKYREFGWEVHPFLEIVKVDGVMYCLSPEHKVLTADLRWVRLGDVKVGDSIVAFDENPDSSGKRSYRTAVVTKHDPDTAPLMKVTLGDGTVFKATREHRWLVNLPGKRGVWLTTQEIADRLSKGLLVSTSRLFNTWYPPSDKEAGYVEGLLDGEGCLSVNNKRQGGFHITIAQKPGVVMERLKRALASYGVDFSEREAEAANSVYIKGTSRTRAEFLGLFRAERLIRKFVPEMLGRVQGGDGADVSFVSVEEAGLGEIIKIETSTGTMIAEGFPHHNCHYFVNPQSLKKNVIGGTVDNMLNKLGGSFSMGHQQTLKYGIQYYPDGSRRQGLVSGAFYQHDEEYMGPQGNASHWRGIVYKHEVKDGCYDPMFVSIDYLRREYL